MKDRVARNKNHQGLPRQFLVQMARDRALSTDQEAVFLLRFADQKPYDAIAHQLHTSAGACLKRMGQVYKKFGTGGATKGKENRLRIFLLQQYQQHQQPLNGEPTSDLPLSVAPGSLALSLSGKTTANHSIVAPIPDLPEDCPFPEFPAGQVKLASRFYIERPPIETRCYEEILQPGALIRIKASRQMGKTSLLARILHQAEQQGYRKVNLSFQLADRSAFASLDALLQWLCSSISRSLHQPNHLADTWDPLLGSKINCKFYFEQHLLPPLSAPLVLGLDEVDRVFQYADLAEDFLSLLRSWHEEGKHSPLWQKLRLVVVHSTEIYMLMDVNQSPFHVGLPIELANFTPAQVGDLAQRYDLDWQLYQIEQLMSWVAGHPFLTQVALYHIARGDLDLAQFSQTALAETGIYSDHLRRHLWNLEQQPELAAAMKAVVASNEPVPLATTPAFKLHSMGLICLPSLAAEPGCRLYRQYFQKVLGAIAVPAQS